MIRRLPHDATTKRVIANRERIGRRWHGLDGKALARFVADDPDVEACKEAETARDIAGITQIARRLMVADAATLALWRRDLGDAEFEKLFAVLAALAKTRK
jgi:hypothetical protein